MYMYMYMYMCVYMDMYAFAACVVHGVRTMLARRRAPITLRLCGLLVLLGCVYLVTAYLSRHFFMFAPQQDWPASVARISMLGTRDMVRWRKPNVQRRHVMRH